MSAESTEHAISPEAAEAIEDGALSAAQNADQDVGRRTLIWTPTATADKGTSASRLEEEGDVAADYLEELLDIADIDGDIDIEVRNGRTYISIVAEEESAGLANLVGKDGEVLDALQELTRLACCPRRKTAHAWCWTSPATARNVRVNCRRSPRMLLLRQGSGRSRCPGADERLRAEDCARRHRRLGLVSESEGEGANRHIVVSAD